MKHRFFAFRQRMREACLKSRQNFSKLEPRRLLSADFGYAFDVCYVHEREGVQIQSSFAKQGGDGSSQFAPGVVADYVDDFQSPTPGSGWQYLWNEASEFGISSGYSTMSFDSWRYRPSDAVSFPYLGATFGHSGDGVDEGTVSDRFAIAAFTVGEDGFYSIADSLIERSGEFGDGVEVSVHVSGQSVMELLQVAPQDSGSFDTSLGFLSAGETIYVGVGPDGPGSGSSKGNDGFSWDFSIVAAPPGPVTVAIDLDTQRYVGDTTALDRDKFFTFHSSGGGNDQQIADFQDQYDVATGRQFWGPFPYAVNQTGEVGVYPDVDPSSDETVRPTDRVVQTSHPRDALRWDTDLQEAADWVTTYFTTVVDSVPEFYEPINEPFVHAGDAEFSDAPSAQEMREKMAQLFAAIGEAIDQTPALADVNVIGYSSAWPSVELWDFGHWETRMKMFMDVAGQYMDAFATHLYDGVNVTGQNNRRSGSNSEAILDLIETYSFAKWGSVTPHAITEYGGIETGFGETYSDIRSAQSLRSQNHLLFNLLEREDDLLISIPFTSDKATWFIDPENGCEAYSAALWRLDNPDANCNGDFVHTWRVNFYELWQGVQGDRGLIETSDPDVQAQLFVDGNTAYVAVNNLSDGAHTIDLDFVSEISGLVDVEIRQMEVPVDAALDPTYTETTQSAAPDEIIVDSGGTAVLVYNFESPLEFSRTVRSQKYYTDQHLQPISADQTITFNLDSVTTVSEGTATLHMGIGRTHDLSKAPEITVNGVAVEVPGDWKGYDQANRDNFFGVIDIPVPIEFLAENNVVEVTFPDSGGRVSSMILSVEGVDSVPEVTGIEINGGESHRGDISELNLSITGLVDFGPDAFSMIQRSDAGGVTGTIVETSFTTQVVDGNTQVTITFDGLTRSGTGSLVDGNYQLRIHAAEVTDSVSGLAMESDYVFGDVEEDNFFVLFGDDDGSRTVDIRDLLAFRRSYLASDGDANFDSAMDYDGNGLVDVRDLLRFRQRYLQTLVFV